MNIQIQPSPDATETDLAGIHAWLHSFAAAVRERDYDRGQTLFDPDVYAFGTRSAVITGIDQLLAEQWNPIWNNTRGFTLLDDQVRCGLNGDTAWVAVPWHSQGHNRNDGWFDRYGRATYILSRRRGRWLAVHSHHSLNPQPPAVR